MTLSVAEFGEGGKGKEKEECSDFSTLSPRCTCPSYTALNHVTLRYMVRPRSNANTRDRMNLLSNLGRRITQSTDDHRESAFLFQRLSVLMQRYNAVAVLGTLTHTTPEDEM